ncbi:hypothetical protein RISK_002064 [Rhodopirellula islandica]|uniref:Uncharacterized protein n=1 Tax=Rhodopirellula islandica TaxID=595434 RepID=A0A0J1BFV2_RHOIS|nr:hypothetical protein RISK_002064 [Rhodopirellula islandica]
MRRQNPAPPLFLATQCATGGRLNAFRSSQDQPMIEQPRSGDSCQPRVSTRGLGRHPLPRRAAEKLWRGQVRVEKIWHTRWDV